MYVCQTDGLRGVKLRNNSTTTNTTLLCPPDMNNRIVKACFAAGCSVAGPALAFSASGFGVKALGSSDGLSSSRLDKTVTNSKHPYTRTRTTEYYEVIILLLYIYVQQ